MSNTVVIIDDDIELTELISQYLSNNGFDVHCFHHGKDIVQIVETLSPDAIILDLMLPEVDGLTLCKSIRPHYSGVIIMLTALGDDIDEVTGLEVGADDYLAKPVKPRVLLAHLRAQIRRQTNCAPAQQPQQLSCYGQSILIDNSKRLVTVDGGDVNLSSAEFDLLWQLALNVGKIVKRESLHEQIFRLPYDGLDRSIDLRISRIRKKLGDDPKEPSIIKTVRNVGYLLAL